MDPSPRNIYYNEDIRGLDILTSNFDTVLLKAFAFADDVTVVYRDHQQDIQAIFSEYEWLTRLSSLTQNADKTEILNCTQGDLATTNKVVYFGQEVEVGWVECIKACGMFLAYDKELEYQQNVVKR